MFAVGFGILFLAMLPDYLKASKLTDSSVAATAQITGVYSGSKGTRYLEYSYSAGGQQLTGKSYGSYDYACGGR
jgi:hypothetical protein